MPFRGRLDTELVADVVKRRSAGESIKVIALDLDLDESSVAKYVAHLPSDVPYLEARRRAIMVCLEEGAGVQDTVAKVGCTIGQVTRIVRAMQLTASTRAAETAP